MIFKRIINFVEIFKILLQLFFDKLSHKKIIVLDLEEQNFQQYILPIYNELKNNKNLSFYISSLPVYIKQKVFKAIDIKNSHQFNSILNSRLFLIDIILTAHVYVKKNKKTKIVHIYHNQPIKHQLYPKEFFQNIDIHFTLGPMNKQLTEDNIKAHALNDIKVIEVGYPKTDNLIKLNFNGKEILENLGLDTNRKTIIYAPSWDENLSLRQFGTKILNKLLKLSKESNIIIKLHPMSYTQPIHPNFNFCTGGINWLKILNKYSTYDNLVVIERAEYEISPLLFISDIMITDVSSVALEYLLLDRPIIYFDCNDFFEKTIPSVYNRYGENINNKENPMTNAGRHTGIIIKDIVELDKAITRAISNPLEFSDKRRELLSHLYFNKGYASKVAADEIKKLVKYIDMEEK